jgi:hypothetical protein
VTRNPSFAPRSLSEQPSWLSQLVTVTKNAPPAQGQGQAWVDNFQDALERVRPGGTIRVEEGEWAVAGVEIGKAVTIEAARGGRPVIVHPGGMAASFMVSHPEGTVTIRGCASRRGRTTRPSTV